MTRDEFLKQWQDWTPRERDEYVAERVMGYVKKPADPWIPEEWEHRHVTRWETPDGRLYLAEEGKSESGKKHPYLPRFTQDIAAAWQVFVKVLTQTGSAAVYADMEDFGRGAITRGRPDEAVTARVGAHVVMGPVCYAICLAACLAQLEGEANGHAHV